MIQPTKNVHANPTVNLSPQSYRGPTIVALILLAAMVFVWWFFFALREEQSVRVLFSAGTFSRLDSQSAMAADEGAAQAAGSSFRTGENGFVTVRLSDGSVVRLMPNTRLDIEDARANARNDRFTTSLRLLSGEVETQVKNDDDANRAMTLFSDSVAIGVRGTVFSVIEGDGRAWVMVTRGQVGAQGDVGDEVRVSANEGTVVTMGSAVGQVVALPAAPQPVEDTEAVVDGLHLAWRSALPQSSYQVEIAQDEAFLDLLKRKVVNWTEGTLPPLERDGQYYWRVASIDAGGLRGPYSEALMLEQDYYLRRSRAALLRGDLKAVHTNLARASGALDEDIDRLRARALVAISQRQFAAAAVDLEMVLALRSADAIARNALANAHFELLDYALARHHFDETMQIPAVGAAAVADAQTGIALIDVREGQFDAALQRVREVLARDASHRHALNVAAMASVGLGERDIAKEYLRQALELEPTDPTALLLRQSLQAPPLTRL